MTNLKDLMFSEFMKRKTRNPRYSLRAYAKWLGLSPAQLSQMLTGKRPVTLKSLKLISNRLELSPIEKKQLASGFLINELTDQESEAKKKLKLKEDQFRLISDWYHLAILGLAQIKPSSSDPRWVAQRLGIGVEQAHQGLLRLERLGLLQTKPTLKQLGNPLEVVSETPSEAIRKYHKQNLNLALEKIETVTLANRQFQSISLPINPKNLEEYKLLIDDFLEKATLLAKKHSSTEVYHLNVQLFPVTITKEKK